MRNNKVLLVCLIGLAMLLVGCGSDVHKVIIEPSAERVDMDEELILTAIGFDEEGRMMALDTRAYWSLSDEHMGDIKAVSRDQAVFIPIREGSVTIYVKVGKATGNLTVDVGQKIISSELINTLILTLKYQSLTTQPILLLFKLIRKVVG